MKNLFIVLFFMAMATVHAQNQEERPELNHLLSPKMTEVVFDFPTGLQTDSRFRMDYFKILGYPFRLDTTIQQGVASLNVKIPVDHPVNMRIRTGDQMDHLFLIPGQKIKAVYNPGVKNQDGLKVIDPEPAVQIDEYYHDLLNLLGISSQRISAYRPIMGRMEFQEKFAAFDSLALIQYQL